MGSKKLGRCQVPGCTNPAWYLIGSLVNEVKGQVKFLYVCLKHDSSIAAENGQIGLEAQEAGLTVVEYVRRQQRGG